MSESRGKQFGEYEAVRELNQVGAATIYAAHRARHAGSSIRREGPPGADLFVGQRSAQRVSVFIARAALQKRVASGEGTNDDRTGRRFTANLPRFRMGPITSATSISSRRRSWLKAVAGPSPPPSCMPSSARLSRG